MSDHVVTAETEIDAPASRVWRALTDPGEIEKYMFGTHVETDWEPGSRIVWTGEYDGRTYVDEGEIVEVEPERRLEVTHSSASSGQENGAGNHHTVTYELESRDGRTRVTLTQDGNASAEAAEHAKANWETVLSGLKKVVESG